jgi:hypothetical protein
MITDGTAEILRRVECNTSAERISRVVGPICKRIFLGRRPRETVYHSWFSLRLGRLDTHLLLPLFEDTLLHF